ncbi:MAG: hypothetical protein JWQ23_2814 [Herminiimonas sp.]|jgi:uncharacterized protein|nr:hypothetical protein [Herminiimonas sp.]
MNGFRIDAFDFSRLNERRSGEIPVSDLVRLSAELIDQSGNLKWSVEGGSDKFGHPQLMLSVNGPVHLRCQRCLSMLPFAIASESALVLAEDEESADAIEALIDDESVDVIVGSRSLDILALVEDEALLALPLAPKHEVCPDQSVQDLAGESKKESPFSVLKNLKK